MTDRIFYTIYRFFEEIHGSGDSAEIAAVVTWSALLALYIGTLLVLVLATIGTPAFMKNRITYVFAAIGLAITASQYMRYLARGKLSSLKEQRDHESRANRNRRRWATIAFALGSPTAFCLSLWFLSAVR